LCIVSVTEVVVAGDKEPSARPIPEKRTMVLESGHINTTPDISPLLDPGSVFQSYGLPSFFTSKRRVLFSGTQQRGRPKPRKKLWHTQATYVLLSSESSHSVRRPPICAKPAILCGNTVNVLILTINAHPCAKTPIYAILVKTNMAALRVNGIAAKRSRVQPAHIFVVRMIGARATTGSSTGVWGVSSRRLVPYGNSVCV